MSNQVVYVSRVKIEREKGPLRRAYLSVELEGKVLVIRRIHVNII